MVEARGLKVAIVFPAYQATPPRHTVGRWENGIGRPVEPHNLRKLVTARGGENRCGKSMRTRSAEQPPALGWRDRFQPPRSDFVRGIRFVTSSLVPVYVAA